MKRKTSGFTLIELLIVIAIIGILAAIAIPNLLNAVARGKQKRTMADMRSVATALEAYAVDYNIYPPATCSGNAFTTYGTALALDTGLSSIVPTYISQVPRQDGWGRAYLYNLGEGSASYNLVSLGKDGSAGTPACGPTTNFNDDIIYSNGAFLQWPEGPQQ
jgi:general secretion pathway protein G